MMDYDPRKWRSLRMRNGFVYLMMFDESRTIQYLRKFHVRVIDRRFHTTMQQRGDKWYWGWVCFEKPIDLYDAWEAGLVPIFKTKTENKNELRRNQDKYCCNAE